MDLAPQQYFCKTARQGGETTVSQRAMTLVELLVVIAIIGIMAVLVGPSLGGLKGAASFSMGLENAVGVFEQARTWAMANNTYVFVGIAEYDATALEAGRVAEGIGSLLLSTVASKDGTRGYDEMSGEGWKGDASQLIQIGKPVQLQNVHLGPAAERNGNLARPETDAIVTPGMLSLLSFSYPLAPVEARYRFRTVLQYNPQGTPLLVQSGKFGEMQKQIEMCLQATHSNQVAAESSKAVGVIQVDGLTGAVRVFRP